MKKVLALLLLSLIGCEYIKSQDYNIIDNYSKSFVFYYTFYAEKENPESIQSTEMILEIGKKVSKFYSSANKFADSLYIAYANESPLVAFSIIYPQISKLSKNKFSDFYVFKRYPTSESTTFIASDMGRSNEYEVTEVLNFDWTIDTDTKATILGYNCIKATCNYAGRSYDAWFTTEIPINDGPYKFNGLPGLIVKISDKDKEHEFELVEVKNEKQKPIYFTKKKYVKTNAKGYTTALESSKASFINEIEAARFSNIEMKVRGIAKVQKMNNFIERY